MFIPFLILLFLSASFSPAEPQRPIPWTRTPSRREKGARGRPSRRRGRRLPGGSGRVLSGPQGRVRSGRGLRRQGRIAEAESLYRQAVENGGALSKDGYPEARAALACSFFAPEERRSGDGDHDGACRRPRPLARRIRAARLHLERKEWQQRRSCSIGGPSAGGQGG